MKKSGITYRILAGFLAALLIVVPVASAGADDDLSITQGCHTIDAKVPMSAASENLTNLFSAFLYDTTSDTLIYAVNPDQQYYPASLVKIMTGLIIAERADLDEQVTVRQDILDTLPAGSLNVGLQAGEIVTMRDLLYCTMVPSANEAAAIAADHICGSQEAFVEEMNAYAAELGCTNTNFVNVHGLHDDAQLSTARDMARILSAAAKNEIFMQAFSASQYTVPATNLSEPRELISTNYFMTQYDYLDDRVTGGRTGTVQSGEQNLAITAESNDIQLVCVVLGSASQYSDSSSVRTYGAYKEASELLDIGFTNRNTVQLFYENQVLKQFPVVNGDSYVTACVQDSVVVLLPQSVSQSDLTYRYIDNNAGIQAPVHTGDQISTIQVWYGDLCLAQVNLYALHDVAVKKVIDTEQITEETDGGGYTVFIVIAVIVGLLLVLIFGQRIILRIIRRRRIRRQRRNRRRSR